MGSWFALEVHFAIRNGSARALSNGRASAGCGLLFNFLKPKPDFPAQLGIG
jgi:hypothetical protein